MKRYATILAAVVLIALIVAAIVPLWTMTSGLSLSPAALGAVVFMIIGCFAVGGGLMFLIFYSARKGYDEAVYHGPGGRNPEKDEGSPRP